MRFSSLTPKSLYISRSNQGVKTIGLHLTFRSQDVRPGSIFFALKGNTQDGAAFIPEALERGAAKVYSESPYPDPRVTVVAQGLRKKMAEMASESAGHPTHQLVMVGITGTSGKTTTTYLTQHLLQAAGNRVARLGTNGAEFEGKTWETANTTPDCITLQNWFAEVLSLGATHVVMEVSSHSLDQERVWGIQWDAAAFLNLSHEHLDYHDSMESYFLAKAGLFRDHADFSRSHGKSPALWTWSEHEYGKRLLADSGVRGFSINSVQSETYSKACTLFGAFQKVNIMAAVSMAQSLGATESQLLSGLRSFRGVPGRMERIENSLGIQVFVDYAHKPEALQKVLESIQDQPVLTVFGCGGDRDKTKRPVMGRIAATLSQHVWVTSDNPRTENPDQIIRDIVAGMTEFKNYTIEPDRRKAIQAAIKSAKPGDLVLIAGKGHEDYQIVGKEKFHFDDREEARLAFQAARP